MSGFSVLVVLAAVQCAAAVWLLASPKIPRWRLRSLGVTSLPLPSQAARFAAPDRVLCLLRARLRRGADERRGRAEVTELCFGLAAELRAGRTPAEALERAVQAVTAQLRAETAGVLSAARTGGEVVTALRVASSQAGAEGLRRLAACWQVGAGSGAGFALAVERLAGALRTEEQHRQEVAAHLAGPRSTARLLAALPLLGVLMSAAMGMRPFAFLLGTPYGLVCLALGIVLDVLGVVWTGRLAGSVEVGR